MNEHKRVSPGDTVSWPAPDSTERAARERGGRGMFEKSLTGGVHALGQRLRELVRDDEIASVVFLGNIVELRLETTSPPFHYAVKQVTVLLMESSWEDVLATTWMEMTTDFHKMRDEYEG